MGKAGMAGYSLESQLDLWILCATVEIGDDAVRKLTDFVDRMGFSVLFLDWSNRSLPALAVLLAATAATTEEWLSGQLPGTKLPRLAASLKAIVASDDYARTEENLRRDLSSAHLGLGALRQKNQTVYRARFENKTLSRRAFAQFILPMDPSRVVLHRYQLVERLNASATLGEQAKVIALLGDEGTGKTWLAASWWLQFNPQTILLIGTGQALQTLEANGSLPFLASLLAKDEGNEEPREAERWQRRLKRWSERRRTVGQHPVFTVLLDGLNERTDIHWAKHIDELAETVDKLNGVLLISSRPVFWKQTVIPRLNSDIRISEIQVNEYTVLEVEELLSKAGKSSKEVPHAVLRFLRNPRVLNLAINLLDRLSLPETELTIERLLMEYWKDRLRERGDLIQHDDRDFSKLLQSHAAEWLAKPRLPFESDEWTKRSGLVQRNTSATPYSDFSDIVEGRFMQASADGTYTFRTETLSFAMGLMLLKEINSKPLSQSEVEQLIEEILDPIRGFQEVPDILVAAFSLSCLDSQSSSQIRSALLRQWAFLQNHQSDAADTFGVYVPRVPSIFIEILESLHADDRYAPGQSILFDLVIDFAEHPDVRKELDTRIPKWLGRWSRLRKPFATMPARKAEQPEAVNVVDELLTEERLLLQRLCIEIPGPEGTRFDDLAVPFLAGASLAVLAEGICAWSLAIVIGAAYSSVFDDLAWVVRSADPKPTQSQQCVMHIFSEVSQSSSAPMREAAAIAFRLLGNSDLAARADILFPLPNRSPGFSWADQFCDTDPLDPASRPCTNIENSKNAVTAINSAQVRIGRFSTAEDHQLESTMLPLARFESRVLTAKIRELVRTIRGRTEMEFRSLAWDMPEYAALLDDGCIDAVKVALQRYLGEPHDWRDADHGIVLDHLMRALFPHLSAVDQLELLLLAPDEMPGYLTLRQALKVLSAKELEHVLEREKIAGNYRAIDRILFFCSANKHEMTPKIRRVVRGHYSSTRDKIPNTIAEFTRVTNDEVLNEALLQYARTIDPRERSTDDYWFLSQAVADVVQLGRKKGEFATVASNLRPVVAVSLGHDALREVTKDIDASVIRLLQPIESLRGELSFVEINSTQSGLHQRITSLDASEAEDTATVLQRLSDPEKLASDYNNSHRRRLDAYKTLVDRVSDEGARSLVEVPYSPCIKKIAMSYPALVHGWLTSILEVHSPLILSQIYNLGTSLAGHYSNVDGLLSSRVLRHIWPHQGWIRILTGQEGVPLYHSALFSPSSAPEMSQLRRDFLETCSNDAEIAMCATAAEVSGAGKWINEYAEEVLTSSNLARQALGITIQGFLYKSSCNFLSIEANAGFLQEVVRSALENRHCGDWAAHWCKSAIAAEVPEDFWSFGKLAEHTVDIRFHRLFDEQERTGLLQPYGLELYERLSKAANDRQKKRKETLFGRKSPSDGVKRAIKHTH